MCVCVCVYMSMYVCVCVCVCMFIMTNTQNGIYFDNVIINSGEVFTSNGTSKNRTKKSKTGIY